MRLNGKRLVLPVCIVVAVFLTSVVLLSFTVPDGIRVARNQPNLIVTHLLQPQLDNVTVSANLVASEVVSSQGLELKGW